MHRYILFLLLMSACDQPQAVDDLKVSEGVVKQSTQRIVGGQLENAYPSIGALLSNDGGLCTATLIHPEWILTAAHCIEGESFYFITGLKISEPKKKIDIDQVITHPNYSNAPSIQNDIALAHLSESMTDIAPMGILSDIHLASSQKFNFVGYGITGFFSDNAGVKRSVKISIDQIFDQNFTYRHPNKNTCSGDSGGPALAYYEGQEWIVGITSYGDSECVSFGVDMRTDVFIPFIESMIGDVYSNLKQPAYINVVENQEVENTLDDTLDDTDHCGNIDYLGACDGNMAIWCSDDLKVEYRECDLGCGWIDEITGFYCLDESDMNVEDTPENQSCENIDYQGLCDGNTLMWCEGGALAILDCTNYGAQCTLVDQEVGFDCISH
jgi:V8-like Glu-specific endopeptidase